MREKSHKTKPKIGIDRSVALMCGDQNSLTVNYACMTRFLICTLKEGFLPPQTNKNLKKENMKKGKAKLIKTGRVLSSYKSLGNLKIQSVR